MRTRINDVSDLWSADGEAIYLSFIDSLRADRALSSRRIHEALGDAIAGNDQHSARRLVYALAQVGHESSIPVLTDLVLSDLPPLVAVDDGHTDRFEGEVLRDMALQSIEALTTRNRRPENIKKFQTTLLQLVEGIDESRHLAVTAAHILIARSASPDEERKLIAQIWGDENSDLLQVEQRQIIRQSED